MSEIDPYVTAYSNTFRQDIDPYMKVAFDDELARRGIAPGDSLTVPQAADIARRAANEALANFLTFVGRGELDLITGQDGGKEIIQFRVDPEGSTGIVEGHTWDWILQRGSVATTATTEITEVQ